VASSALSAISESVYSLAVSEPCLSAIFKSLCQYINALIAVSMSESTPFMSQKLILSLGYQNVGVPPR